MSEGPIKAWRDSRKPPTVSTRDGERVCYKKLGPDRAACGRKPKVSYEDWSRVTCADCMAAQAADAETAVSGREDES